MDPRGAGAGVERVNEWNRATDSMRRGFHQLRNRICKFIEAIGENSLSSEPVDFDKLFCEYYSTHYGVQVRVLSNLPIIHLQILDYQVPGTRY
jgi:hypothetical protein